MKRHVKQSVQSKDGSIKFKKKQLAVPFKIYVHFELVLKLIKRNNRKNNIPHSEKYQDHIPCSFS